MGLENLKTVYISEGLSTALNYDHAFPLYLLLLGIFHAFLGMMFFVLQSYKQKWMSHFDTSVGILMLLDIINIK